MTHFRSPRDNVYGVQRTAGGKPCGLHSRGFRTRNGCEVDAKASPQNTHLPPALATGRYEIRTGCKVTGVNTRSDGLASGLSYIDADGNQQETATDVVVLSGFTLTNVRMMFLHRSQQHPNGLENAHGLVGKHYTYQLVKSPVQGVFDGGTCSISRLNGATQNVIYDFNSDNFDHGGLVLTSSAERRYRAWRDSQIH